MPIAPERAALAELSGLSGSAGLTELSKLSNLAGVQRWMQAVITHPDGVAEGVASDPTRAALGVPAAQLENVVRGTPRLPAEARLRLYSRDYHLRLLDCLRASHPALRELLGAELFEAFALDYVQARPSRSYTLGQLGAGFVEHLERTRPTGEEWALLVCELVRLERAVAEVYDGPGVEGERILTAEELPAEPAPWQLRASVEPVRCLRLARTRFPVGPYLRTVRGGGHPEMPHTRESAMALSRSEWVVTVTDLDADRYAALEALVAGATVGELRELVAGSTVGELKALVTRGAVGELDAPMAGSAVGEGGESRIWEWLREWAAAGFLRRFVR